MTIPVFDHIPQTANISTFGADWDDTLSKLNPWGAAVDALGASVAGNTTTATTQAGIATTKAGLTAGDRVQTGLDAVATAADQVQTGLDRTAAAASAASAAAIAGAFVGTSTTSWTPAIEAKTFTTQTGEQYTPGATLTIVSASTPAAWGAGQVASYSGSSLLMNISVIGSSTTSHTDWNISLAGVQGPPGPAGAESLPSASAGGSADAITATFSPAITLANQQRCCVVLAYANATTTPTFAPNGLAAHTITKKGGAALAAGDLPAANAIAILVYNLANTRWELVNPANGGSISVSGSASTVTSAVSTYTIQAPDSFTTYTASAATGTATISGAVITYTAPGSVGTDTLTISGGGATKAITITVALPTYYIATPAATPANFADPFEGGFYTGKVWNELAESATSTAISTGAKTFTVPDMASVPIIYNGQSLEVRSRANPANKMIGTVTGTPTSTTIGFNCTSVGGSGTFTDWSIMATYRIISAPKSSGENSSIAYKNANTAAPTACQTVTEGYKAMLAMVAADTSTVYPLAWWCKGLTIGGKADWYPPARDEEELQWRNLKPTTDNNSTGARPKSSIAYGTLGSIDDGATDGHGVNNNSNPPGAAYTTTVPAQVAAGKNFRTGESEAFAYGSYDYWSASECSASFAWYQLWNSGGPGYQGNGSKANAYYVRAVRRSII